MYNFSYMNIDSFVFREVTYQKEHHNEFPKGVTHNYIMYLTEGTAKIISSDTELELKEGDICYIPRKTKYDIILSGTPNIRFFSFAFLNYPCAVIHPYKLQKITKTEKICNLLSVLTDERVIDCQVLGHFFLFLDEIFKSLEYTRVKKSKQDTVTKAMSYIISNPNYDNKTVAKYCGISEPGLYSLFKSITNVTPAKFKMSVKLERALNYLLSTDMSIEEISDVCDFSSTSYFRKNFYKVYKMTPREMRKNNTNNSKE